MDGLNRADLPSDVMVASEVVPFDGFLRSILNVHRCLLLPASWSAREELIPARATKCLSVRTRPSDCTESSPRDRSISPANLSSNAVLDASKSVCMHQRVAPKGMYGGNKQSCLVSRCGLHLHLHRPQYNLGLADHMLLNRLGRTGTPFGLRL